MGVIGSPQLMKDKASYRNSALKSNALTNDRQQDSLVGFTPAAILGVGGDEAIHGVLDIMNADVPYDVLRRAMPIHPTVSELIPTMLGELRPAE